MNVVCQSSLGDAALLGLISSSFFFIGGGEGFALIFEEQLGKATSKA